MFVLTETVHEGWELLGEVGVKTSTTVRLVTPGEVEEEQLVKWLKKEASFSEEYNEWTVEIDGIGTIESLDDEWDCFVEEVMRYLNDYGVSITDRPGFKLES